MRIWSGILSTVDVQGMQLCVIAGVYANRIPRRILLVTLDIACLVVVLLLP